MKFHDLCVTYQNSTDWHGDIFDQFFHDVQNNPWLKAHRDFVENNGFGMNDRPMHEMWRVIVEAMPSPLSALEIGVYRGQVVSLIGMIARHMDKIVDKVVGVGLYAGMSDGINAYDKTLQYAQDVKLIFDTFDAGYDRFIPVKGWSQDRAVVDTVAALAPFDLMYIDGSHDYTGVRLDINNYVPMIKKGGILVMDDSSFFLNMPEFSQDKGYNRCWKGEKTVSLAVRDWLETREDFVHRFAIGHNRVFEKVS